MKYQDIPIYLEFPVFQISYFLFWIFIGFKLSVILSGVIVTVIYSVTSNILERLFSFSFDMFVMSGRMANIYDTYLIKYLVAIDLLILITGLEIIRHFLDKKRASIGIKNEEY